jgi:4-amino-4-deoxy-L-arabinose transferase-like glycosyltransferase
MRFDEAFTFLRFASRPLSEGLTTYTEPNNHLFHTLLVHISTSVFGDQPWAIRLPALLAGIALVPITYWTTRIHYNAPAGLLAAGLVAASSVLIEFSTNARGYTLVCCCFMFLLGLAHCLRAIYNTPPLHRMERGARGEVLPPPLNSGEGWGGGKYWLAFALLGALGMYTVPTMIYPLGIVTTWLVLSIIIEYRGKQRRLLLAYTIVALCLCALITILLYLPVIAVSGANSLLDNRYVQPVPWQVFPLQLSALVERIIYLWNRDLPQPLPWLLLIGALVSLVMHHRLARYPVPLLVAAVVFVAPALLIRPVVGFPRTWLFLLPLYLMSASAGLVYLIKIFITLLRWSGFSPPLRVQGGGRGEGFLLLLTLLLAFFVLSAQSIPASEETGALVGAQSFAKLIEDHLQPGDGILALRPADAPLEYYFRLNEIPTPLINTDLSASRRLFVIVYERASTLAETLARVNLSIADYGPPQLLLHIETAALYLIERQG